MRKLMTMMLGLSLLTGAATVFAQEKKEDTKKEGKKKGKKGKKDDAKKEG